MNEPNNFSKRFFADFIAARLNARRMEKDAVRQTLVDAVPGTLPSAGDDSAPPANRADSRPGELPPSDRAPYLLPGLGSSN